MALVQVAAGDDASATINNSGSIVGLIAASAVGTDGDAWADATLLGGMLQGAIGLGHPTVSLNNAGSVAFTAAATASGEISAAAFAVNSAIYQIAEGSAASVVVNNNGEINVSASGRALAAGTALAFAEAGSVDPAITQFVIGAGKASLVNAGAISEDVNASAIGGARAIALAELGFSAFGQAVIQSGSGAIASATLVNEGELNVHLTALASGGTAATASAFARAGISQSAQGAVEGLLSVNNSGRIGIGEIASAVAASGSALADVSLGFPQFGIHQFATGLGATEIIDNGGEIDVIAQANARGAAGATAEAEILGALQTASVQLAELNFANSGTITVGATAQASAYGSAIGTAVAGYAIAQEGTANKASLEAVNSGNISVQALALADGSDHAVAHVFAATAMLQAVSASTAALHLVNSGAVEMAASASAIAKAGNAIATAEAFGRESLPKGFKFHNR